MTYDKMFQIALELTKEYLQRNPSSIYEIQNAFVRFFSVVYETNETIEYTSPDKWAELLKKFKAPE